jgi:sulfur-carrier protein
VLTINYFASIREKLNRTQEQLELPGSVRDVAALIQWLATDDPLVESILNADSKVLVAVNQTVVGRNFPLTGNEEVAFFPPMTGG